MNNDIKFSVLISIYRNENEESLKLALASLLNQTLLPTEIVMVFDGPVSIELSNVVEEYQQKVIDFFVVKLPENQGLGKALNYGLNFCKYDYIARMDADDICYPERFEKQMSILTRDNKLSAIGASVQEFNLVPGDLNSYRSLPVRHRDLLRFAKYRNPLNHPTVIFKKADVLSVGSYQDMSLFEDYFLWVRLLKNGFMIQNITEPLLHFRVGNDMIGRRHGWQYLKKEFTFLNRIKDIGFITTIQFYVSVIAKLPTRLMPRSVFRVIYKLFLR